MVIVIDYYITGWPLLCVGAIEIIIISYVYGKSTHNTFIIIAEHDGTGCLHTGAKRFACDIEIMLGDGGVGCLKWSVQRKVFLVMWLFVSPVIITVGIFHNPNVHVVASHIILFTVFLLQSLVLFSWINYKETDVNTG